MMQPRRPGTPMLATLTLLMLIACGGDSARDAVAIDTLPGGVVQVVNHAPSGWQDSSGWRLVLERTVAPEDGSPGELARPWSLAASEDGTLYVLDLQPAQVKVFDSEGRFSHLIGRQGEGPAEYSGGGIHRLGDTLVVHDPGKQRMVLFHLDGRPLGEISLPDRGLNAQPTRGDGAIPVQIWMTDRTRSDDDYFAGRAVKYLRPDGSALEVVRVPPVPKPAMWELREEGASFGTFVPFVPTREYLLRPSGIVTWGDQERYTLIDSRSGEDTLRIITAPESRETIPDSLRQRSWDAAVQREEWIADRGRIEDIPTRYPSWLSLAADGTNHLWVQRRAAGVSVADVFNPDGVLLGTVPTPFQFHPRDLWTVDRVFHPTSDEDGRPVVEVYRIVRDR
jgi:hypothetical protein